MKKLLPVLKARGQPEAFAAAKPISVAGKQ